MKLKVRTSIARLKLPLTLAALVSVGFLAHSADAFCLLLDPTTAFGDDNALQCYIPSPLVGYAAKPGSHCTTARSGHLYDFRINSQGLRGPEHPPFPPKGTKRIFLVGSSIFFAPGLKENETPAANLERSLRKEGQKVEVMNVSVEGYSALQLYMSLEKWINAYHPDLVLFNLTAQELLTDQMLTMVSPPPETASSLPDRLVIEPYLLLPKPIRNYLYKNETAHKIVSAVMVFFQRLVVSWRYKLSAPGNERENKWADISVRAMQKLQEMSERKNFKFFIVVFSTETITNSLTVSPVLDFRTAQLIDLFTPAVEFPITALTRVLWEKHLPYFQIVRPEDRSFLLPRDYHFNATGTATLANELLLKRSLYLPGPRKRNSVGER